MIKHIYDNKVDATQLVQIKFPAPNSSTEDWPDYKHVEGQIEFKDVYYNYVGVKMTKDTMYLICVANSTKTKLVTANSIVAKNVSDVPLSKKGHEPTVKKLAASSEYNNPAVSYSFLSFNNIINNIANPISSGLTHPYIKSQGKPPQHIC